MTVDTGLRQQIIDHLELIAVLIEDLIHTMQASSLAPYRLRDSTLSDFSFPRELSVILQAGRDTFPHPPDTYPVNPFALLLAIREAEKGRAGLEFGIMHPEARDTDLRTQAAWCAGTIRANFDRYASQTRYPDYIDFLGSRYAPLGASNDPGNLNRHWPDNVRFFYDRFNLKSPETLPPGGE